MVHLPSPRGTFDFIAIGESLRDIFYFIHDATLTCSLHKERCLLCLEYAEKIPVTKVVKVPAAGNSANAAVGAARLGLKTALVTWVGSDHAGKNLRESLHEERVDCCYVSVDQKNPTSEATILIFQGERTMLAYFQPRSYRLPKLAPNACLYYSAVGLSHATLDRQLLSELKRHPQTFFVFQPGTTHIRQGLDALKPLIARSSLFILNADEARHLLGDGERKTLNLLATFHRLGAGIVIITDGPTGADAFDGTRHWHMPIFSGEAKERTGAGDSFAVAAAIALFKGKDISEALRWGTANSWSVVREIGPQKGLLTTTKLQRVLRKFSRVQPKYLVAHTMT